MNLRRAGTLKNRSSTVICVPRGKAPSRLAEIVPPVISIAVPMSPA
jgi:hypothetical protein